MGSMTGDKDSKTGGDMPAPNRPTSSGPADDAPGFTRRFLRLAGGYWFGRTRVTVWALTVALIVLTHRHPDHSEIAPALRDATKAPIAAFDPALCAAADPLTDGAVLRGAGLELQVLATPGHSSDSASLVLSSGGVLTGDSILGRGTTVVAHPDGNLADYLASLQKLRDLGDVMVLPGHGPELPSARAVAEDYLAHRAERLDQIRAALETLGADATARQIVEHVYRDVPENVWAAAELSVRAQLEYLSKA